MDDPSGNFSAYYNVKEKQNRHQSRFLFLHGIMQKAVAMFTPRHNNTMLAIFMLMVTYSMHVYILKMAVSPLCVGAVFISFTELETRLVCCA